MFKHFAFSPNNVDLFSKWWGIISATLFPGSTIDFLVKLINDMYNDELPSPTIIKRSQKRKVASSSIVWEGFLTFLFDFLTLYIFSLPTSIFFLQIHLQVLQGLIQTMYMLYLNLMSFDQFPHRLVDLGDKLVSWRHSTILFLDQHISINATLLRSLSRFQIPLFHFLYELPFDIAIFHKTPVVSSWEHEE